MLKQLHNCFLHSEKFKTHLRNSRKYKYIERNEEVDSFLSEKGSSNTVDDESGGLLHSPNNISKEFTHTIKEE